MNQSQTRNPSLLLDVKSNVKCEVHVKRVHSKSHGRQNVECANLFCSIASYVQRNSGMEKYVDDIQEKMRAQTYVDFSHDQRKLVQINAAAPSVEVQQQQTPRWQFENFEKTSGYVLLPNMLYFQTTAYETSDELREALLQGLRIVHEVVGLDFVQAIGLRTLDAVVPRPNEDIKVYLKPNLLVFLSHLKGLFAIP